MANLFEGPIRISANGRPIVSMDRFAVSAGRITFLFGESGIGKSLVVKSLFGVLDPDQLRITLNGTPYREYLQSGTAQQIRNGFLVFQEPSTHLNPLMRIRDQLREGSLVLEKDEREILGRLWGKNGSRAAEDLLSLYPKPYRPSGGEKQRILLAMAFKKIALSRTGESGLFAFDEPTGSLDDELRNLFLDYLFEWHRQKRFSVLLITHDYSMVTAALRSDPLMRPSLVFQEIARTGGRNELREYAPENYGQWITRQRSRDRIPPATSPVLSLQSGFQVFGKRMVISRDPQGRDEQPLELRRGRITYLKAPSGVGKTSLAKAMMGLLPAHGFYMTVEGETYTERDMGRGRHSRVMGRIMTMVFQHADESLNLASRAADVLKGLPLPRRSVRGRLRQVLGLLFDESEIGEIMQRKIRTLSGGQKQRLNLLRSLVLDCSIVLLDEPLNGLDFEGVKRVLRLLDTKKAEGKGILVISHNEEIFDTQADDVFYLNSRG